jgi:hypothetical protein
VALVVALVVVPQVVQEHQRKAATVATAVQHQAAITHRVVVAVARQATEPLESVVQAATVRMV